MKTSRIGLCALAAISWAMAGASVTGVVVDDHGKLIAGADVWLMTEAVHNQGPLTIGVTSTDAAGKFLFRYDVPFGALVTCSAVAPGRAIDWHLAAGPKAYARLVLKHATPREGSVVDEDDKPIPGATVWPTDLYATPPSPGKARGCVFPQQVRARLTVTTDASGHFVLPWLTEGSQILLEADAPGYARVRPYDFWRTPPGPLKIILPRPATVEGTVTCEVAPAAVQGLTIHATVTDVDQGWYAMAKAVTDAHGRFRLEGLPPGQLSVDCSPPDTQPWRPKLIGTSRLRGLSLGQTAVLTFPLVKGILVHGRTVEQASGQPIPGVRINLSGMSVSANATSDAAGNYSLYALPTTGPAFVRAEAWPVEYLPVREQPKPSTDPRGSQPPDSVSLTPGTVAPVEGPTLQFSRAMTLPGRVLDETGRPAPGAVVLGTHGHDTIAGEDGSFTLASLAIGSTVFVWAESDGLWPASAVAVTTSAHPAPVTLKLSSKNWCRLRCLVLDENGAPVEGATVSGWGRFPGSAQPSTGPNVQGETGADGRFVSPPVPAIAEYSLMAFLQNKPGTAGTQTSAVWQAVAGEDHDFGTLSFPKPRTGFRGGPRPAPPADGTVSGRVVDNAGNPVASARVFNRGDSPPPAPASGILRTAADGRFTLAHLYRGPVWVFVEDARVLGAQGYGFAGKLAKTGDDAVEITLPPPPGPSTVGKPRAFDYPPAAKEPAIVRTAIDDLWQWAKDHKQEQRVTGTYWQALAVLAPQLAATFPNGDGGTTRTLARAHEMLAKDPDGAIALIRSLPNEPAQCAVFIEAAQQLTPTRPAQAMALLDGALALAAAQTDPYNRIAIPAGVGAAMRPLDPKRAEMILRRTAALAGAMGHDDEAAQSRIAAAAALAPIDPDAAMALVKDLSVQERPHALARLAVALADAVPARSEALLDQITEFSSPWTDTRREVCLRMARVDPERALKIARASDFDELRAVYLAEIALVLAEARPEAAPKVMDEAYATLDPTPTSAGGGMGYQDSDLALLRLAYFGVRLGYSRTDEMVMRAMSMRPDPYEGSESAARTGMFSNDTARRTGQVAELLALFDHDAARALLEGRYLEGGKLPSTESTGYPGGQAGVRALAMLDPEWALKLAEEAPETEQKFSGLPPKEEALGSLVYYFATPVADRPLKAISRDPMVWMNVLMGDEDDE